MTANAKRPPARLWMRVVCFALPLALALPAWELPSLLWHEHSDWIHAKRDGGALGDGVADDSAALQRALDAAAAGPNNTRTLLEYRGPAPKKTVYLPPGTYRITRTLVASIGQGGAVIGCGKGTRIVWDGPAGGTMLHSDGSARQRWIGLVWDGKGVAARGIFHNPRKGKAYETRITHRFETFQDFTGAGLSTDQGSNLAASELLVERCRFERCERGFALNDWNDYDNWLTACAFVDCRVGVFGRIGNFAVRWATFESSRDADVVLPNHSSSIRRSWSTGSKMFIRHGEPVKGAWFSLMVEDCRVDRWKHPAGALHLTAEGTAILSDCRFTNPPSDHPPVALASPTESQSLLVSACESPGARALVQSGERGHVLQVPAGRRQGNLGDPSILQLPAVMAMGGKVFDARRDFGAKGDGLADDVEPIQRALDAARKEGQGAIAYLPAGAYLVSKPLQISGGPFTVAGSGVLTLLMGTAPSGPVLEIREANGVTLENFAVKTRDTGAGLVKILHHGGPTKQDAVYDGIYVFTDEVDKPPMRGIEFSGLGSGNRIRLRFVDGNVRLNGCAAASVFMDHLLEGALIVEGPRPAQPGFLGIWARWGGGAKRDGEADHVVRGNQDLIVADYYTEQTTGALVAEGDGGPAPGRLSLHGLKLDFKTERKIREKDLGLAKAQDPNDPEKAKMEGITTSNYRGLLAVSSAIFRWPTRIASVGAVAPTLLLAGNMFATAPDLGEGGIGEALLLENYLHASVIKTNKNASARMGNRLTEKAVSRMTEFLDHFRELGSQEKTFLFVRSPAGNAHEAAPRASYTVLNKGIGGNNTRQALARFDRDVLSNHPAVVVIYFGMNDAVNSKNATPEPQYREKLAALVSRARAAGIAPILITITPVIESYVLLRHPKEFFEGESPNAKITRLNAVIKSLAESMKVPLVDLAQLFVLKGEPGEAPTSLIRNKANTQSTDGIHYTVAGYQIMGEAVFTAVKPLAKPGDTIVCLGDSLTFGAGVPGAGTTAGATYPGVLETLLNRGLEKP